MQAYKAKSKVNYARQQLRRDHASNSIQDNDCFAGTLLACRQDSKAASVLKCIEQPMLMIMTKNNATIEI